MIEIIFQWLTIFPPEIASALLASLPVSELRVALPVALAYFDLPPLVAYTSTVIGNLIPIAIIYRVLPPLMRFAASRIPVVDQWLNDWLRRLEEKYAGRYDRYGSFFLFLFVALPLPGSGVWTGTVLAVLFDIKTENAIRYIIMGVLASGLIVLGITTGVLGFLNL